MIEPDMTPTRSKLTEKSIECRKRRAEEGGGDAAVGRRVRVLGENRERVDA